MSAAQGYRCHSDVGLFGGFWYASLDCACVRLHSVDERHVAARTAFSTPLGAGTSVTVSVEEASEEESSDSPKRRASHRIGDIIAMTIESERRDDSNEHVDRLRKMWSATAP